MSFEFCTHPETLACQAAPEDSTRCVVQAKHEAWILAEAEMETAQAEGKSLYFTPKPDLVDEVDMTHESDKLQLGATGNTEQISLPTDFNDVPDVDHDALAYWRQHKER